MSESGDSTREGEVSAATSGDEASDVSVVRNREPSKARGKQTTRTVFFRLIKNIRLK